LLQYLRGRPRSRCEIGAEHHVQAKTHLIRR
jgi:hypothetical protein